jgi:hypothetical protein
MPRQPKLLKKKVGKATYWYTETGGETYFGNVDSVPYSAAKSQVNRHVINVTDAQKNAKTRELMDFFLDCPDARRGELLVITIEPATIFGAAAESPSPVARQPQQSCLNASARWLTKSRIC